MFYTLLDKIDELSNLKEKLVRMEHRTVKLENGSVTELSSPGTRRDACGNCVVTSQAALAVWNISEVSDNEKIAFYR